MVTKSKWTSELRSKESLFCFQDKVKGRQSQGWLKTRFLWGFVTRVANSIRNDNLGLRDSGLKS